MKKKVLALSSCLAVLFCASCVYAEAVTESAAEEAVTESAAEEAVTEGAAGNSSSSEEYDFKTFRWGDLQEDVEAVEGTPDSDGEMSSVDANYIVYDTTVAGKSALLAYYFCDDGLFQTRYILTEEHSNENLFIDDYEDIRDALTKKYGEPSLDWERWQDDSKEDYYANKKGDALCYGYLTYVTYYSLDRTIVAMEMSADNYDISTTIDFQSLDISAGEPDYSDDF